MSKYTEILRNLNILRYPLICPFIVGLQLPEIVGEKHYRHIPFLVCFPVFYTGLRIGQIIEEEKKKINGNVSAYPKICR